MRLALVACLALAAAGCWDFDHLATLAPADAGGVGGGRADAGLPPARDDLAGIPPDDLAAAPDPFDLTTTPPSDLAGNSCTPGAACSTGSPGVCSAGHISCASGSPVCAPDSAPAAEEGCFNDTDDDCDGHVNNGCPDHLVFGAEHELTWRGGTGGGSPQPLRCPAGSFVIKAGVWGNPNNAAATGIEITCASYTLEKSGTYSLSKQVLPGTFRLQAGITLQEYLGTHGAADCTGGLLGGTWFTSHDYESSITTPPTRIVSGFGPHCGDPVLVAGSGNQLDLHFDARGLATQDVCYLVSTGVCRGTAHSDSCGSNEVLVGFNVRMGHLMDSIAAVCAPLLTVYQ